MTNTNKKGMIFIPMSDDFHHLCRMLRDVIKSNQPGLLQIESEWDVNAIRDWTAGSQPASDGRLSRYEALVIANRVGSADFGEVTFQELCSIGAAFPNLVELDCVVSKFPSPTVGNERVIITLRGLFPRLRRLIISGGEAAAVLMMFCSQMNKLISFEWHELDGKQSLAYQAASMFEMWYEVADDTTLRHVALPFAFGVEPPLKMMTPTGDVLSRKADEVKQMPQFGRARLSFVQTFDDVTGDRMTSFIRKEKRLIDWKWGRIAAAIAFAAANSGHPLVNSGVIVQAGLIQMIGAFHGGDEIAEVADQFDLNCPEVKQHSQEVEAEKKTFYPLVEKIVFDSRYGQAMVARTIIVTDRAKMEEDDSDVEILDVAPPPLPGPSRKNKRKDLNE